jgi:allantoinase
MPGHGYAHERPFSAVHSRIPYSPIVDRSPISWPGGRRLALWVVPNIEHYEYGPPVGAFPAYPRTPDPDVRRFAYHDYGNRVGFWRMLEVIDRWDIACTASLNVGVLDLYPQLGEAMAERGWDLMSHGLYNTRFLTELSYEDERGFLEDCNAVLRRHTGRNFDGMLGPYITATPQTPDVMAEVGMRFHADWVHDERPSPLRTKGGHRMVALPYNYEFNDAPLLMRSSVEADEFAERCIAHFDALYNAEDETGRMMCIVLHPFTIGQPHRISALDRVFAHVRAHDDVWVAGGSAIVDHYLAHNYDADLLPLAAEGVDG